MFSRLSMLLPRDESTEDKFKDLLGDNPLGARVYNVALLPTSAG